MKLLLVVPDGNWEAVMGAILARPESLQIHRVSWKIVRHSGKDSGVRLKGAQVAATLSRQFTHALLILDHDGCGDRRPPAVIEASIRAQLRSHWADRGDVVVVSPELELWLWRAGAQIAQELGVTRAEMRLRLEEWGLLTEGQNKPTPPKDALERLLRWARKVRSSAIYASIASSASLRPSPCETASYPRMVTLLRSWFPPSSAD